MFHLFNNTRLYNLVLHDKEWICFKLLDLILYYTKTYICLFFVVGDVCYFRIQRISFFIAKVISHDPLDKYLKLLFFNNSLTLTLSTLEGLSILYYFTL